MGTLPTSAAPSEFILVTNPFDGSEVGSVPNVPPDQAPTLIDAARKGARICRDLSRQDRASILRNCASLVARNQDDFAQLIVAEAGKTIRQARKEVQRCLITLELSAEEARRNVGELVPFDGYPGGQGRQGWFTREPLGLIAAITPYNDPLNLAAHKLGPAIAGGNAVLLKPSDLAPLSATKLVDYLRRGGLPDGIVTPATGGPALGEALVSAREVRMVSFTGGFATGEKIARAAGLKRLAMDLGGNAPVIVLGDCDIDAAIEACVSGSFWASGQNCVGTRRILIQASIYEAFKERFVAAANALSVGDPTSPLTDVGPMITKHAADHARATVESAVRAGARVLCGHHQDSAIYAPTVLEGVRLDCDLWQQEAFSPVVVLQSVETLSEALTLANTPEYSLHAGIFTNDLSAAMRASEGLDAGGIMINDSSDYRFDGMPFGGFKYGSLGREGVRFAYEEMTQPKVVCIRTTPMTSGV